MVKHILFSISFAAGLDIVAYALHKNPGVQVQNHADLLVSNQGLTELLHKLKITHFNY